VFLYKALGGGWMTRQEMQEAELAATQAAATESDTSQGSR